MACNFNSWVYVTVGKLCERCHLIPWHWGCSAGKGPFAHIALLLSTSDFSTDSWFCGFETSVKAVNGLQRRSEGMPADAGESAVDGIADGTVPAQCPTEESSLSTPPSREEELSLLSNIRGGFLVFSELSWLWKGRNGAAALCSVVTVGLPLSLRHWLYPIHYCIPKLSLAVSLLCPVPTDLPSRNYQVLGCSCLPALKFYLDRHKFNT